MVGLTESNLPNLSCPKIVMISSIKHPPLARTKSFLLHKYIEKGLSIREIATQTFSCRSSVARHLKRHGIDLRPEDKSCTATQVFGSRYVSGRVHGHQRELDVIEKMKSLRDQGHSYDKIAQILNAMKIRTRKNVGPWYAKTVRQVLLRVAAESGQK